MFGPDKVQEDASAFFNGLLERKFSEAEKLLYSIELGLVFYKSSRRASSKKVENNPDYIKGYIKALEGMLTAARSGDDRTFLNRTAPDVESLEECKRQFTVFVRNYSLHPAFDRGFFSGWLDFIVHQQKLLEQKKTG